MGYLALMREHSAYLLQLKRRLALALPGPVYFGDAGDAEICSGVLH
jgi:hypothetical protein